MKAFILVAAMATIASSGALADGFVCANDKIIVKIYNHVDAKAGTRTPAVMVVSDPNVQAGRKTIARFTDANGRITSKGAHYSSDVDLRFSDSSRKGELIGGTKLGELDTIVLDVDYNFSQPVDAGSRVSGLLTLNKRNGKSIEIELDCKRYLKQ